MNEASNQPDRRRKLADAAFVFRYLRPYRLPFCAAILSLVASTSLGLCFPYLTGVLLDSGFSGDKTTATLTINRTAMLLLSTLAAQAVFSFFSTSWFYACGEKALTDLRRETFSRLIGMPMAFFSQRRIGELSSRLTNDLTLLQDTLTMTVQQTLRQSLLLTGGIFMVAWTSLRLSGLMISTFPVLVLVGIVYGRYIRRHAREAQDRLAEAGTVVDESLQGIANVKAFGNERFEFSRYSRHLDSFLRVMDPEGNFIFSLEINGAEVAQFKEASGLKSTTAVFELEEGGMNQAVHKLPGQSRWGNIVLRYGVTNNGYLLDWRNRILQDDFSDRRNGSIILRTLQMEEVRRYNFVQAWPVGWDGPNFDAGAADLAIESIEIAHHGITVS